MIGSESYSYIDTDSILLQYDSMFSIAPVRSAEFKSVT